MAEVIATFTGLSSKLPVCPKCGKDTYLGKKDLMWGESEIVCPEHGVVGTRDHEFGMNIMDE